MRRYEPAEVSDAKTEVADILGMYFGGYDDNAPFDNIEAADAIVELLLEMGWRSQA